MEHKDPHLRSSLWERPKPEHESPQAPLPTDYPKHLHKLQILDGEEVRTHLDVYDADAEKLAVKNGWSVDVPLTKAQKQAVKDQLEAVAEAEKKAAAAKKESEK